jgi:glycosyltransferase involved in cell wall biosynthesis
VKIALDARLTRQMSAGMKTYVRALIARLPAAQPQLDFVIFSNERFLNLPANATLRPVDARMTSNGSIAEQFSFARLLEDSGADVVHFMSIYAPRRLKLPHVYTIHDLIHLRYPRYFSWKVPPYYRLVVRPVAQRARLVITDAQATVGDLHRYLGVNAGRVRVVPLAASDVFTLDEHARPALAAAARQRYGLEQPYFLYAGNHRPHKNLETLVEAWRMTRRPCDLVLTEDGPFGFSLDAGNKSSGRIAAVGHVSETDLAGLYAGCAAAVQPSLYEGFGLGVLEAMAAGAATIISRTPALLELASHASLTFAPHDARELAHHMETLLADAEVARALREAGRKRSLDFSWSKTAQRTAQLYEEAMAL